MGLPVISARALTVSPTPTLRPPCLRGFLCRSCAPDTGTHEGWRCCDYFEKSWDPGSKSTPELPGCVRGWSGSYIGPRARGPTKRIPIRNAGEFVAAVNAIVGARSGTAHRVEQLWIDA